MKQSVLFLCLLSVIGCIERAEPFETERHACYIGIDRYSNREELPMSLFISADNGSEWRDLSLPFLCNEPIQIDLYTPMDTTVYLEGEQPYDVDVNYHWDLTFRYRDRYGYLQTDFQSYTHPNLVIDLYAGETLSVMVGPVSPLY